MLHSFSHPLGHITVSFESTKNFPFARRTWNESNPHFLDYDTFINILLPLTVDGDFHHFVLQCLFLSPFLFSGAHSRIIWLFHSNPLWILRIWDSLSSHRKKGIPLNHMVQTAEHNTKFCGEWVQWRADTFLKVSRESGREQSFIIFLFSSWFYFWIFVECIQKI